MSDNQKLYFAIGIFLYALIVAFVAFKAGEEYEWRRSAKITEWIGKPPQTVISIPDTDKWYRITNATKEPICIEMGHPRNERCGFIIPPQFETSVPAKSGERIEYKSGNGQQCTIAKFAWTDGVIHDFKLSELRVGQLLTLDICQDPTNERSSPTH